MAATRGWVVLGTTAFLHFAVALGAGQTASSGATLWPTSGWAKATPASVGIDEKMLSAFDADIKSGKYGLVDSFNMFRCGKSVYESKYAHDYGQIYGKQAKERGPLNARLTGPYN